MKGSSEDLNKSKSRGLKSSYPKYNSRSSNHVQMEKTERIINFGRLSAKNTQKVWPRRNNQQNIWKLLINLPSNISRDRSLLEALQNEGISTAGTCKDNKAVTENLNNFFAFVFSTVFHTEIVCDQLQYARMGLKLWAEVKNHFPQAAETFSVLQLIILDIIAAGETCWLTFRLELSADLLQCSSSQLPRSWP